VIAVPALTALLAFGSPAPQPPPLSVPDLEHERALAALVSAERATTHVRELVELGPRMGGTESGNAAARYLLRTFQAERIPTRLLEDPETWCHAESSWSVAVEAEGETAVKLESAWPWGFSPPAEGSAVLSLRNGEGVAWLTQTFPFFRKKKIVPAVMLVDGETTLGGGYPVLRHLRKGDQNPYPVFGLSRADGELLRTLAAEDTAAPLRVTFALEATIRRARPRTVIAHLRARPGAPPGFVLFCAHGDSDAGGPGANDNASGEAILLEIATAWSRAVREGLSEGPPRELRFAIWGKEIHSSRAYLELHLPAEEPEVPLLGVVNFDQSGFGSGMDQLFVEPDDLPANSALIASMLGVLADHAGEEGFPKRWATNGSLGGTDSYVFSKSDLFKDEGLPAVMLYASAWGTPRDHPRTEDMRGESWRERDTVTIDHDVHYHSAGDTARNTTDREPWNMAWGARVGMLGVLRWLERL